MLNSHTIFQNISRTTYNFQNHRHIFQVLQKTIYHQKNQVHQLMFFLTVLQSKTFDTMDLYKYKKGLLR